MAYTEQEKDKWVEIAQDTGDSLERTIPVLPLNQMDKTVSIPGVVFPSIEYNEETGDVISLGKPDGYAQLPLGTLVIKTQAASDAADAANAAAVRANAASDGAEQVDATLVGMTVTITDRQGVSHSQNIGFEIYSTYGSVAEMNADADNVPEGKFVMIATADPTSAENARLYGKNSEGGFTFLSDLDQASAEAWADWLNNMKPEILDCIEQANEDHTRAEGDHSRAEQDHTTAGSDHSTYEEDHAVSEAQQTTFEANEAQRQQDFEDAEAQRMKAALLTQFYIDPDTMELHALQVEHDDMTYRINDDGDLIASFEAEVVNG